MALFKVKNHRTYKVIFSVVKIVISFFFIFLTISFFQIVHREIEGKDYTKFCYALFAANAIICNSLFALGNSPIFIKRFNDAEVKLIYFSATAFLYATIVGFILSGWIYINIDKNFVGNGHFAQSVIHHYIIIISLVIGLCISIILSIIGIVYFFKWTNRALEKFTEPKK